MKGIIVINPFGYPNHSVKQAERLKEEFNKKGVNVEIVKNGFLRSYIDGERLVSNFNDVKFAIFLDKDKYLSKEIELLGIKLYNSHDAIRVCDDKGETCLALINSGVKMPKTVFAPLCYRRENNIPPHFVDSVIEKLSLPVIVKESFGSMGFGVHKADTKEELLELMERFKCSPHLYQEYVGFKKGVDVRVIVIGKKAVASMERRNFSDFRSNVGQGGEGVKVDLPESFRKTAERCAEILNLDYCGVDILYGERGEPIVCEVNSNAFFEGIEKTTGINVAKLYVEHIIDENK